MTDPRVASLRIASLAFAALLLLATGRPVLAMPIFGNTMENKFDILLTICKRSTNQCQSTTSEPSTNSIYFGTGGHIFFYSGASQGEVYNLDRPFTLGNARVTFSVRGNKIIETMMQTEGSLTYMVTLKGVVHGDQCTGSGSVRFSDRDFYGSLKLNVYYCRMRPGNVHQ